MTHTYRLGARHKLLAAVFVGSLVAGGTAVVAPQLPTAAAQSTETTTRTYEDGAKATLVKEVSTTGKIHVTGTGFFTKDKDSEGAPNTGSTLAVKLDNGAVNRKDKKYGNATIWEKFDVPNTGAFSVDIDLPTVDNSDIAPGSWDAGTEHDLVLLSGSLRTNDYTRGEIVGKYTIVEPAEPTETTEPTKPTEPTETAPVTTTVTTTVTVPTTVPTTVTTTVPTTVTTTKNEGTVTKTVTTTVDRVSTERTTVTKTVGTGTGAGTGSVEGLDSVGSLALVGLGGVAAGGLLAGALATLINSGAVQLPEPFAQLAQQFALGPNAPSQVPTA